MLAGIGSEYLLEVGAADSQHYLVGMEELSIAGEGHVHQVAAVVQILEAAGYVVLEVLPAQLKLVVHRGCGCSPKTRLFPIPIGERNLCAQTFAMILVRICFLWLLFIRFARDSFTGQKSQFTYSRAPLFLLYQGFEFDKLATNYSIRIHAHTISSRSRPRAH